MVEQEVQERLYWDRFPGGGIASKMTMYLLLFRKPHTVINLAIGKPPEAFSSGIDCYRLLHSPRINATYRVDADGFPIAIFCRLMPGHDWPADIDALPRLARDGSTLIFWLTTKRDFEPRDILCDDAYLYQAAYANFAFAFSLQGIGEPGYLHRIHWPPE